MICCYSWIVLSFLRPVCLEVLQVPPQCLLGLYRQPLKDCFGLPLLGGLTDLESKVFHLVFISSSLDRISLFVPLQRSVCGWKPAFSDPTSLYAFLICLSFMSSTSLIRLSVCSFPVFTYFMGYFPRFVFHSFSSGWSVDPFLICCIPL